MRSWLGPIWQLAYLGIPPWAGADLVRHGKSTGVQEVGLQCDMHPRSRSRRRQSVSQRTKWTSVLRGTTTAATTATASVTRRQNRTWACFGGRGGRDRYMRYTCLQVYMLTPTCTGDGPTHVACAAHFAQKVQAATCSPEGANSLPSALSAAAVGRQVTDGGYEPRMAWQVAFAQSSRHEVQASVADQGPAIAFVAASALYCCDFRSRSRSLCPRRSVVASETTPLCDNSRRGLRGLGGRPNQTSRCIVRYSSLAAWTGGAD